MSRFLCVTCGTQDPESETPPNECLICQDERQYVGWTEQGCKLYPIILNEVAEGEADPPSLTHFSIQRKFRTHPQ